MVPPTAPGLLEWLAGGSRGVSSNTIVTHLTGVYALGSYGSKDHPYDPDDFDRCLCLLDAVPLLRVALPYMAEVSPGWAALVDRWGDIEASHLEEVGLGWSKAKSAPKTYDLMRSVIDAARQRKTASGY